MNATIDRDVLGLATAVWSSLGTSLSQELLKAAREGDWDRLVNTEVDPGNYTNPMRYALDKSAASLLSKYPKLPTSYDKRAEAVKKWREGEVQCYHSNERLGKYADEDSSSSGYDPRIAGTFWMVRKVILSIIGPRPPDELVDGAFGPGSTLADRGRESTIPHKMSSAPHLTAGCLWHLPNWLSTAWGKHHASLSSDLVFVRANRFATVPKTAKTDRAIGIEPSINLWYQKFYGRQLRRLLLKNAGIDLDYGQSFHQHLARKGSLDGSLATIDLSNASDTLSTALVRLLLPVGWHSVLDDLRSKFTEIDGQTHRLEKFSSMGNGFTFELETLIFYALARVASEQEIGNSPRVTVYGDDIIVPASCFTATRAILEFCGFSLNAKKSFATGPFRESCGGDYFQGAMVRPFFLKDDLAEPSRIFAAHNGLRRLCSDMGGEIPLEWLMPALGYLKRLLPSRLRSMRGPAEFGDLVLLEPDVSRIRTRTNNSIRYIRCLKPGEARVVKYRNFHPDIQLASLLYGAGVTRGGVIPRDSVSGYVEDEVPWS